MWKHFLAALVLVVLSTEAAKFPSDTFRAGIKDYLKNGQFTPEYRSLLKSFNMTHALRNDAETYIEETIVCPICDELLDLLLEEIRSGAITQTDIQEVGIELCTSLVFESLEVCEGAINSNLGLIWYIIEARPERTANTICGIIAQSYGCTGTPDDWSIQIADGSSEANKGIISDESPLQILHLTDIHYDSKYAPDSLGNCDLPVCCTAGTVAENEADAAGFWGDYRDCDTPLHAIDDALQHIAAQHTDVEYVYYTGDTISHRVWDTSIVDNTNDITLILDRLEAAFPNIPIYPILGNHEPHPLNVWAPLEIQDESLSTQWLFDLSAEQWSQWLDDSALETVRRGGFYTTLVRPGLRVIALNSNVAYTFNWWLIYDDVDPYGQLQWFADTLYEAEQNGEKVHILSHVPSSDSTCYAVWSREYRRIIDRFAGTISATFNGHTHREELIVYHSIENPTEAIGVAWNGGSLTTYSDKNPNYKLIEIDSESYEVLDYQTWSYNLTAANLLPDVAPEWVRLYSFKEAYGLSGATPSDVRQLAQNMAEDLSVAEQYFRFSVRDADSSLASGCGSDCLQELMCKMLRSEFSDETQCDEFAAEW